MVSTEGPSGGGTECRTYLSNRLTSALSAPRDSLTGRKMPGDGPCQPCQHRDELTACSFWPPYCTNHWHFPRDRCLHAAFLKMYSSTPRHIAFLLRDLCVSPPARKFALWCRQQTQTFTSLLQTSKRPSEKTEDAKMWNGNGNGAEWGS